MYTTSSTQLVKATVVGLLIATAVGALWGMYPAWAFYCALLLGFGVAEGMAWSANYKRGRELQIASIVAVFVGIVVSRLMIAQRSPVLTIDMLLNDATNPAVARAFQLQVIPDFLFMGIAVLIVVVRFR